MKKEAIGFGDSITEATEDAKLKLGLVDTDDYEVEVLEQAKKKTLGIFGGSKAQVRVFIEVPDKKENNADKKQKKNETEKPKTEKKPVKKENKEPKEIKDKEKKEKKETSLKEEPAFSEAVSADTLKENTPAAKAVAYLKTILDVLDIKNIDIKVALKDNGCMIVLDGEGLGVVIGRRGDTLDALQYLVSLASNMGNGYYRVSLNIGNYREKREKALEELANKVASQVLRTGRSRSLEPMNPYERRIIHTAIQGINGVTSASSGEGSYRHVVVSAEGGRDRRNQKGRYSEKAEPVGGQNHTSDKTDLPLYGKIK